MTDLKEFDKCQAELIATINRLVSDPIARVEIWDKAKRYAMSASAAMIIESLEIASTEPTYAPVMTATHEAGVTIVEPVTDGC